MKMRAYLLMAATLGIWSLSGSAAITDAVKAQLDAAKTTAECQAIVAAQQTDQDIADALAYLANTKGLPLADIVQIANAIADTKQGEARNTFVTVVTSTVTGLSTKVENNVTVIIVAPVDDNKDVVIDNGKKVSQPAKP